MDKAYSVKRTSDGGYIVAGRTGSYGSGNADILEMRFGRGLMGARVRISDTTSRLHRMAVLWWVDYR